MAERCPASCVLLDPLEALLRGELVDRNGTRYTGFIVLDRGLVVAWLAIEAESGQRVDVKVDPYQAAPRHHSLIDPDSSIWDRDGDPFRR